jgi:3-hydroxyisobutyrate dehydrogenase-like beta-hydroxyacid dehydrogenase
MTETIPTLGFIGLGVMGGPMCRNVATKHPAKVHAFDLSAAALDDVAKAGAIPCATVAEVAKAADIVFLSLPGGAQVREVCLGADGLAAHGKPGMVIVDLSTTGVAEARAVAAGLEAKGFLFADAPVARTREAAQKGTLSIMVGASDELYARIEPLLAYMGSDIALCGGTGCGQVVKLINNTLVFEHTAALAEMLVVGERAGVKPETLLAAVSNGSGDSFVLRNHGMKAMLPRVFPEQAFPAPYALKDLGYSIELAESCGVEPRLSKVARQYFEASVEAGIGEKYFPAIIELIDKK